MRLFNIFTGWARKLKIIKTTDANAKLSKLRLSICSKCPKAKESKIVKFLNGSVQYEHCLKCTECGCPCLEKSLVISESCPLGNW